MDRTSSLCVTHTHEIQADQFFLCKIVETLPSSPRTIEITQQQKDIARGIMIKIPGSTSDSVKYHKQNPLSCWFHIFLLKSKLKWFDDSELHIRHLREK